MSCVREALEKKKKRFVLQLCFVRVRVGNYFKVPFKDRLSSPL